MAALLSPLRTHPDYARLFAAQLVAILGTGLMTVALGLLAWDLAGPQAGAVLGTVFTIKMTAYVGLSPLAQALVARWPRKIVLIAADLARASVALCLPFVTEVWQVYGLVFLLQAASATFTPAYQSVLPDLLPDEGDYTRALSLSRLAYDLENLMSPALAGLLLLVMPFNALFAGTVLGFLGSAWLVQHTRIPASGQQRQRPFRERLTRGTRLYLATPRLRGLLVLTFGAASVGAFVLVNTVVLIRDGYGVQSDTGFALAMAAFGAGSVLAALALPRVLERVSDRAVMIPAALALALLALSVSLGWLWFGLPPVPLGLLLLAATGTLYSSVLTPTGRLLRRSSGPADRPALFAAQFALSHACWLISYPLAGWLGAALGLAPTLAVLSLMALVSAAMAPRIWQSAAAPVLDD